MEMFKNMRDLQKIGRDMEAQMGSPADRMSTAQERMANMQQTLANQTAAANAAAAAAQGLLDGTAVRCTTLR